MLRCNMEPAMNSQWDLEDLLADLRYARKRGDLGRLAFLAYCDVRRWARDVGKSVLADQASRLITDSPHNSRDAFVEQMDQLILELESIHAKAKEASDVPAAPAAFWPAAHPALHA